MAKPPLVAPQAPRTVPDESAVQDVLRVLWAKYRPLMQERLATLDLTLISVEGGDLSAGQRRDALDAAHKFAGSLGMFGFQEGTDAARKIEHLLLESGPYEASRLGTLVATLHGVLGW